MKFMLKMIASAVILALFGGSGASACTLWAAAGSDVSGGGTILVKNRDWYPNHEQILRLVRPKTGYAYFGLYADNKKYSGFKAGINEKGLVIVSASASSIPRKVRMKMTYTGAVIRHVLAHCATAEEAAAYLKTVRGPQFLMFADRRHVGSAEISPSGENSISIVENGTLAHTNHYHAPALLKYNVLPGKSSHARYTRISDLLWETPKPYHFEDFLTMADDHVMGPDDSIFRTGSTKKSEATIATWAVSIPKEGSPLLSIRILNPGKETALYHLSSEDVFQGRWENEPEKGGLPLSHD